MTHLPIVDFKTMEKVLFNLDFQNTRSKGSHFFYRHLDGKNHYSTEPSGKRLIASLDPRNFKRN